MTDGASGEVEKVTLLDVKQGGGILVLSDGRNLRVHPADMSATLLWMPSTTLEISKDHGSLKFPLNVRNTVIKSDINANWK